MYNIKDTKARILLSPNFMLSASLQILSEESALMCVEEKFIIWYK